MTEINFMLEFIEHYRINDYFLNQAIAELKIGFALSEYLNPDQTSHFEPIQKIKIGLLSPNTTEQAKAIELLLDELNIEYKLSNKIIETLDYLVPIYLKNTTIAKDKKRRELQLELLALDK